MSLKTKIALEDGSGSINLQVDDYTTRYDAKSRNSEATFRGSIELELHTTSSDYNNYNEKT
jgi:hypothetical protein